MGNFPLNTKSRSWMVTINIANMIKAGLKPEEYNSPETLAKFLSDTWENSGPDREVGVVVCRSYDGLYHAHAALYGRLTTLKKVAKIMYDSHVEPQLSSKGELRKYLLKEPPYDEKGEEVLYSYQIENVKNTPGKRSIFEEIDEMLAVGMKPSEIMERGIAYRRYEKLIKSAYLEKRVKDTAYYKSDMIVEYHTGQSGSGKTHYYVSLVEKFSEDDIYLLTDYQNGGLDLYIEKGAPKILFIDELKGSSLSFGNLLTLLDRYSRAQTHSRYANTYNLWTTVIITSIFYPEELYEHMVDKSNRGRDRFEQFKRRLTKIVYHYVENNEYKTFSIPASEYKNKDDLIARARGDKNGFIEVENADIDGDLPFDK